MSSSPSGAPSADTAAHQASVAQAVVARRVNEAGALMPILHELQDTLGYIPRDVVPLVAEGLNLSRAEVHGVVTYYHHFRNAPPGRHTVQVCRAEACKSMGADALLAHVEQRLGCTEHGSGHGSMSADGKYSLDPVFCLGLCASSPAIVIDDKLHARMTTTKFDKLIAELGETA